MLKIIKSKVKLQWLQDPSEINGDKLKKPAGISGKKRGNI
jgi:hypothetical protein